MKYFYRVLLIVIFLPLSVSCYPNENKTEDNSQTENIKKPTIIGDSCVRPDYPPTSIKLKQEGKTTLELFVSEEGIPIEYKITSSSGFELLDDATVKFFMSCRFNPALRNGEAVKIWFPVRYAWKINYKYKKSPFMKI